MVKVTATHNVKPKRSEDFIVESLDDLVSQIDATFNIEPKTIAFMKPLLKV